MEINIAVTGRNGSGKSSLIACIYEVMREKLPGYFSLPEAEDFDALDKVYKELEAKATSEKSSFSVTFNQSGSENWEYQINHKDDVQFFFQENPDDVNGTKIFIAAVDAPLLMNNYEAQSGISEAKDMFINALDNSNDDALLLIVPVKSEAYTRQDKHALTSKITSALGDLASGYKGRSAIAIVPVNTMGGASFTDFLKSNGTITGEIFRRDKNVNFKPENGELVMKLIVSFLIHNGEISSDNMRKIAGLAGGSYEILCGHELLDASKHKKPEPKAPRKSVLGSAIKISAVIIILLAMAGAGYYAVKSVNENAREIIDESNIQAEQARAEAEQTRAQAEQEISEAKEAERAAILERNKARNDVRTLQDEKDRAMEMANRYKKQADDLKAENERLQAEVNRLTKKLNDSIRIPNPFK
ncbi:MAG: AAA family ATPase [Synergistaceae bacterium]|nr:AAA family ATPase [Synergistaceae bacterium]